MPTLADLQALRAAQGATTQRRPTLADLQAARGQSQAPAYQASTGDYLQQVAKGGTFGLVDEIGAGLGAARMAVDRGSLNNLGEDYNIGLHGLRQDQAKFEEENPLTSIALQTIGGAPAALKAAATLATGLGGRNLATRALASGAAGAASGAAYGFGTGEGKGRLQSAGQGAMAGGILGAAFPIAPAASSAIVKSGTQAAKTIGTGVKARTPEMLDQAAQSMRAAGSSKYQESKNLGAVLSPQAGMGVVRKINYALSSTGINNARLHGDTLGILQDFTEAARNKPLSLEELDQHRQLFQQVVNKNTDVAGKMNPDALKASRAIDAIDRTVENIGQKDLIKGTPEAVAALQEGRSEWAKARSFERVSDIIRKAGGDPNRLKSKLQQFVNNPKNLRGFRPEEQKALKNAASMSTAEKLLKMFGKFGLDLGTSQTLGNTFLPLVGGLTGNALGGVGTGGLVPIAGTMARQGQKYLARGKAEQALRLIEQR